MPAEWRQSTWGDEITLEYGKGIRSYSQAVGAFRVFGSNGPIGWTSEALAPGPGVILGRKGAYRGVRYSTEPFYVIDTAYYVVPKTDLDMRWLYYAIIHHKLGEIDDGSPIPSTTRSAVYVRDLEVPPPDQQRAIASTLGALDDKIELNRRMNETLEAIARAVFKSWFVDFDPVRAKAEGRQPYVMDAAAAAVFQDTFEDSSLGKIPKGWTAVPLPAAFDVNPPRSLAKGAVAPYLDMANMPTTSPRAREVVDRPFGSGVRFSNGDTLIARITPCLENGKTAFVDFLENGEVGWGSTEYIVLRSKPPLPVEYAYFLARSVDFRAHAILNMTGTSGRQRVPISCFDGFLVAVPPAGVAEKFGMIVTPLMAAIKRHDEESCTLAAIRDALLPKLMSGKIRVKEAEPRVAEAV